MHVKKIWAGLKRCTAKCMGQKLKVLNKAHIWFLQPKDRFYSTDGVTCSPERKIVVVATHQS